MWSVKIRVQRKWTWKLSIRFLFLYKWQIHHQFPPHEFSLEGYIFLSWIVQTSATVQRLFSAQTVAKMKVYHSNIVDISKGIFMLNSFPQNFFSNVISFFMKISNTKTSFPKFSILLVRCIKKLSIANCVWDWKKSLSLFGSESAYGRKLWKWIYLKIKFVET